MKKGKKFTAVFICMLLASVSFVLPCAALESYTVLDGEKNSIPEAYIYSYNINVIEGINTNNYLNQPDDLFIDSKGFLWVADTKNNRVLKLTDKGALLC